MAVTVGTTTSTPHRTAPQRWAYPALMGVLMVALGTSGAPAPLYGIYADEWQYAPITTTIVFAVYAAAALVAVLTTGAISDRFGRKPVLLTAIALIFVGLAVFATAESPMALMVARTLHGLGVGACVVAGTAALLDVRPGDGARTGARTGIAFNAGIGAAVLGTAWIADAGPDPLVTPFVVLGALTLIMFVAIALMHETHTQNRAVALHIARPRVPSEIAHHFRFSALGVMASWSVLGVFLSLFPVIAAHAVGATHVLFGGAMVAAMAGSASVSMAAGQRLSARSAAIGGDIGTAAMLLISVLALDSGNGWLIAAASVLLGLSFGLAFSGSLRHLTQRVPAQHRGEVMSAFYLLAYIALGVPTIVAGLAATHWGTTTIFLPFMATVAVFCVGAAVLGLLTTSHERPSGSFANGELQNLPQGN